MPCSLESELRLEGHCEGPLGGRRLSRCARWKLPCTQRPRPKGPLSDGSEMAPPGFGIAQNGLGNGRASRERAPARGSGRVAKAVFARRRRRAL